MSRWCAGATVLFLLVSAGLAQEEHVEENVCYGPGSIAASVILTFIFTVLLIAAGCYWYKKYRSKGDHLILETDPERGKKAEFAFDNPGFKDTTIIAVEKSSKLDNLKPKWSPWSPLSALTTKHDKRKTQDDSVLESSETKSVTLRGHDFAGLGFTVCGNMKDGIYIREVLQHGPAHESGRLAPGDRLVSVTVSFEHVVYEDALAILSYASPYEVVVEARGARVPGGALQQGGGRPCHPVYRSSSCVELQQGTPTKKQLFGEDYNESPSSNYSSLQKSRSNMTTLERKESKSPKVNYSQSKKPQLSPSQLKTQLEQRITIETPERVQSEIQKTENKYQKFGVKVLPMETQQKSPKIMEQNENNLNIEKHLETPKSFDEIDEPKKPQAKKREKKPETFEREGSLIKRDENGIPQELPNYMFNAAVAVAAKRNRRNSDDKTLNNLEDDPKTPKKVKGKAPMPPEESKKMNGELEVPETAEFTEETVELRPKETKDYNSDSDAETDNNSSVNTIELNSSDITIHQTEQEQRQGRKTASTGDLSKIQKPPRSNTGTLERAQSLDITDTGIAPGLKRSMEELELNEIFDNSILNKEPRLSLILDGLSTFQKNRLKKSTEWGNLEDAILSNDEKGEEKQKEFDAVVNKINEIKRESQEIQLPSEILEKYISESKEKTEKPIINQIWPTEVDNELIWTKAKKTLKNEIEIKTKSSNKDLSKHLKPTKNDLEVEEEPHYHKRQQKMPESIDIVLPPNTNEGSTENIPAENLKSKSQEESPRRNSFESRQMAPNEIEQSVLPNFLINDKDSELKVSENVKHQVPDSDFNAAVPSQQLIKDEWEISINNTSPPLSLNVMEDEVPERYANSLTMINTPDETKEKLQPDVSDVTQNFLYIEKLHYRDEYEKPMYDTNISDDIKVSRSNHESVAEKKCDNVKTDETPAVKHISNVNVSTGNGNSDMHSLEFSVNDPSELYTTALDKTTSANDATPDTSVVTISTPDLIKNVTITEAIATVNKDPEFLEIQENSYVKSDDLNKSLTYITEIQVVTPNSSCNVSEIEIIPKENTNESNLESAFEDYVKNFEAKLDTFEKIDDKIRDEPKSISLVENVDMEKEVNKIHEIAEEQLKKLPEMRFTTSSYESGHKTPEKKHSFEQIRSNFEKSSPKKETTPKSRIPIATTAKTPPMSPERRDSRNLENENDRAILELMSSSIHSTPFTSKIKPPNKNITVTSIRNNSKIPSGLPTLGGSKPPLPPRKSEHSNGDNIVQVSTNGGHETSFKQWVFNPSNVTNVTVESNKDKVM